MKTLICIALAVCGSAAASTVSILSGVSAGESNNVTGANVAITPADVWASDPAGAEWISDQNSGVGGTIIPNSEWSPFATFYQTFTVASRETGTLRIWADDTAGVYLDGGLIKPAEFLMGPACAQTSIGCTQANGYALDFTVSAGEHTFAFPVYQLGGFVSGVLYDIQLNPAGDPPGDPTPEPAAFMLTAIGLFGLMLKKRKL